MEKSDYSDAVTNAYTFINEESIYQNLEEYLKENSDLIVRRLVDGYNVKSLDDLEEYLVNGVNGEDAAILNMLEELYEFDEERAENLIRDAFESVKDNYKSLVEERLAKIEENERNK